MKSLLHLSPDQTIPGTGWRITRWLGEGNLGVVYEAQHVVTGQVAAIKIAMVSLVENDPAVLDDFRREARALAAIGSPNIAEMFDFAVLEDGRLMMALELVAGCSLRAILVEEGRLGPNRVVRIFRQVCAGLADAHERGLVHRDIKPENIMVDDTEQTDAVTLLDFGVAAILGERTSTHVGTPHYAPPEGMFGGAIDGRYDIYSLGCVMYEALTGRPPFVHADLGRVFEMHMDDPMPPLLIGDVPAKLVEVVRRCMEKNPADRYASMAEVEAALCEAQVETKRTAWDDVTFAAVDVRGRAQRVAERGPELPAPIVKRGRPRWWAPAGFALGVGALSVAWPMLSLGRADREADSLVASSGMSTVGVAGAIGRWAPTPTLTLAAEPSQPAIEPEIELLEEKPVHRAPPHGEGKRQELAPSTRPLPAVAVPLDGADQLVRAADEARTAARLSEAEDLYHEALGFEQHHVGALSGLGRVYFEQANYPKSVEYYAMAVQHSGASAELSLALGDAYFETHDYDRALEHYAAAKELGSGKTDARIAAVDAGSDADADVDSDVELAIGSTEASQPGG